jgi:hypothetical protein
MQIIVKAENGSRAVVINVQESEVPGKPPFVWATLWVNAPNGDISNATITPSRWKGSTLAGAKRWANKILVN